MAENEDGSNAWTAWLWLYILLIPITFIVAMCVPWSTFEVYDTNVQHDEYGEIVSNHPNELLFIIECRSSHIRIKGKKIKYSKIIDGWKGKQCVPDDLLPLVETQDWYKPEEGTCDFKYHRRAKRTMVACFILSIFFFASITGGGVFSALCSGIFTMITYIMMIPFPFSDNMCGKSAQLTTSFFALICLIAILILWPFASCFLLCMEQLCSNAKKTYKEKRKENIQDEQAIAS